MCVLLSVCHCKSEMSLKDGFVCSKFEKIVLPSHDSSYTLSLSVEEHQQLWIALIVCKIAVDQNLKKVFDRPNVCVPPLERAQRWFSFRFIFFFICF